MSDEDGRILVAIQVTLGKIEENLANLSHRFKNLEQAHQQFVPRREIDATNAAFDKRLSALEDRHEWLNRALWAAWISGGGVVAFGSKKLGLW